MENKCGRKKGQTTRVLLDARWKEYTGMFGRPILIVPTRYGCVANLTHCPAGMDRDLAWSPDWSVYERIKVPKAKDLLR